MRRVAACRSLIILLLTAALLSAATRINVTVLEPKTGKCVTGLKASDFVVLDDKTPRTVEAVEEATAPLDIMLLLDTSLVGAAVQPVAAGLIGQLQEKDEMAVVSFHSSADLVQGFTASKELLSRAVGEVKYGNMPHMLDALFAAIDGGFDNAVYRRVALLLTTGFEGGSQVTERQVIKAARKNAVSIVPVFVAGQEKRVFEVLARQTGGASFNLNDLRKSGIPQPGATIFEALRRQYVLTVAGNLALGDKVKIEVRNSPKLFVSALAQE